MATLQETQREKREIERKRENEESRIYFVNLAKTSLESQMDTLQMDEILSCLTYLQEEPVRVSVSGKDSKDIIKALDEDYFYDPESSYAVYEFVDDPDDADLEIVQRGELYRYWDDEEIWITIDISVTASYHIAPNHIILNGLQEQAIIAKDIYDYLADELVSHIKTKGITSPSMPELEIESLGLGWEKIIIDHEYNPAFTKKMRSAVCSKAKRALRKTIQPEEHEEIHLSEGWLGLRELFVKHLTEKGLSQRDTMIISNFYVPEFSGQKKTELRASLRENEDFPDPSILQPAFNMIINRNKLTNSALGTIGEQFTHSFLSPSVKCFIGPKPTKVCDISDHKSGDPSKVSWAVNVKLSTEDSVNRSFEVSPEHQVSKSWVLLIMPRQLQMRLFAITGGHMTINSKSSGLGGSMRLCVSPEQLADTMQELIQGESTL